MAGKTVEQGRLSQLSFKQRVAFKAFQETLDPVEAARRAGYAHPEFNAYRIFKTKAMKKALEEAFEERGITTSKLAEKHHQLLNSKDQTVSIKALDMAYRLRGEYESENEENKSLVIRIRSNIKEIDVTPERKELDG